MNHDFAIYQIIIFLTALFLILRNLIKFLNKKKSFREAIVASTIWLGFGIVGLFPNLTQYIANITGFQLGINAILVISIIFLFLIVLSLLVKDDKTEQSITKLVREIALKELNNSKNER